MCSNSKKIEVGTLKTYLSRYSGHPFPLNQAPCLYYPQYTLIRHIDHSMLLWKLLYNIYLPHMTLLGKTNYHIIPPMSEHQKIVTPYRGFDSMVVERDVCVRNASKTRWWPDRNVSISSEGLDNRKARDTRPSSSLSVDHLDSFLTLTIKFNSNNAIRSYVKHAHTYNIII